MRLRLLLLLVDFRSVAKSGATSTDAVANLKSALSGSLPKSVPGDVVVLINVGGNDFNDSPTVMVSPHLTANAAAKLRQNLAQLVQLLKARYDNPQPGKEILFLASGSSPSRPASALPLRRCIGHHPPMPSLRELLSLAWPIVISRSSQVVVGVADAVMVASLGEAALAATTTGALNTFTLFILPMGIVFIVSSFASQLTGAGDHAGARRYGFYGLGVAALTQLVAFAAMPLIPTAIAQLDYSPEVRRLIHDYLRLRLLSGGAAIGLEALGNYYGGVGNTRLPAAANVLAMLLNLLGNWILIGGHLGAPALGVAGAALASTVSTLLAFTLLLLCFLFGIGTPGGWIKVRLSVLELGRTLRFGIPSGLNWFLEMLAFSFFINVVFVGLGTTSLAAMMSVMQVNSVAFMPAFGVASAGAILVGQAIGAGQPDHVPKLVRLTLLVTCTWQGLVGLAYAIMPRLLLAPFTRPDVDATLFLAVGRRILLLAAAWQIFDAIANTIAEALRAAGDTAFTLWARVAVAWLVFVPGVLFTVRHLGGGDAAATAWVAGYIALLALILALRFRSGAWRRIDLTGHGA